MPLGCSNFIAEVRKTTQCKRRLSSRRSSTERRDHEFPVRSASEFCGGPRRPYPSRTWWLLHSRRRGSARASSCLGRRAVRDWRGSPASSLSRCKKWIGTVRATSRLADYWMPSATPRPRGLGNQEARHCTCNKGLSRCKCSTPSKNADIASRRDTHGQKDTTREAGRKHRPRWSLGCCRWAA